MPRRRIPILIVAVFPSRSPRYSVHDLTSEVGNFTVIPKTDSAERYASGFWRRERLEMGPAKAPVFI
jgi:hypothetical protein